MTMQAVWLNEGETCSFLTLVEASGLSGEEVQWLMESGALMPLAGQPAQENGGFPAAAPVSAALTTASGRRFPSATALPLRSIPMLRSV